MNKIKSLVINMSDQQADPIPTPAPNPNPDDGWSPEMQMNKVMRILERRTTSVSPQPTVLAMIVNPYLEGLNFFVDPSQLQEENEDKEEDERPVGADAGDPYIRDNEAAPTFFVNPLKDGEGEEGGRGGEKEEKSGECDCTQRDGQGSDDEQKRTITECLMKCKGVEVGDAYATAEKAVMGGEGM